MDNAHEPQQQDHVHARQARSASVAEAITPPAVAGVAGADDPPRPRKRRANGNGAAHAEADIASRLEGIEQKLESVGARANALATRQDVVALHKSLLPALTETRKLVGETDQSVSRVEGFLTIDLKRLVKSEDPAAAVAETPDYLARILRLEWTLRAALIVFVVQMVVMIGWLVK